MIPVRRALVALACALAAAVLLGAPGGASAAPETLTLAVGADPVAGLPNGIDYEYDTAGQPLNLTIVARPATGPTCGATAPIDRALVGASGGATDVTPTPIEVSGAGGGRVPFTFTAPGAVRVCAWLARSPDDATATAVANADVRLPHASLTLAATEMAPKAGGADIIVRATGMSEAPSDLYVTVVSGALSCPPTFDQDTDPTSLDPAPAGTPTRVTGGFDLSFQTVALLSFKPWRLCGYLQDGTSAAAASATGSTAIDLVLKPALLRRPRVRRQGGALVCDGGRWRARPAAKLSYAWLAGGQRVAGGMRRTLAIKGGVRGKTVVCRVTATNKLGRSTATSRAVRAG
jgi:hypothetical protein